MSKLLELALRCEKSEGPDRELDAMIWCELNGKRYKAWYDVYGRDSGRLTQVEFTEPPRTTRSVSNGRNIPHALPVTASLDAAMTLIPDAYGRALCLETKVERDDGEDACMAFLTYEGSKRWCDDKTKSYGATPALALCAAALRALASQEDQSKAVGA